MAKLYKHKYDGKDYVFRDSDESAVQGRIQVAALLGVLHPVSLASLRFHLHYYSGGMGVIDKHAISINADETVWDITTKFIAGLSPRDCLAHKELGEDFKWLLTADEPFSTIKDSAIDFINDERADFQTTCTKDMRVLFDYVSNVNSWRVIWGTASRLNYLAFDQG